MIANQLALVRRELWEHKSLYVTPAVVALVLILTILTAFVFASGQGSGNRRYRHSWCPEYRRRGRTSGGADLALLIGNTVPFILVGAILTTFYCLDSLYAERKSKSILFWRSLPITDAETVVSKLLTAALAIPLVAFAVIVIAHLVILLMTSIFVSIEGGNSMLLIWKSAPLFDAWAGILLIMLLLPIWFSPFIGWFLFVSAWTKRSAPTHGILATVGTAADP